MKKRGLAQGRGLDALLGSIKQAREDVQSSQAGHAGAQLEELPLEALQRGEYQPRREMSPESLNDLAASIQRHGVMQPIVVRRLGGTGIQYEIVAGERRWRAAKQAGLSHIPAIIRDLPDELAIALALIENIQREDLSPMEQANALQRFHDEFGMSHQEIADAVGKARTTVSNLLRLIGLQDEVKRLLEHGDLDMGHARALLALEAATQLEVAREVVARGLSVRQTEQLIRERLNPTPVRPERVVPPDLERLNQRLSERFGAPVQIEHNDKGKGRLTIRYHSLDELDGILAVIDRDA
ncbi:MAG: ParB/RepB/Spo0J family partition protein [Pseudomonadota bacterium]|nr:ParB/RepB/Spo0J family partition protein [Pseudomonadota bacterium]